MSETIKRWIASSISVKEKLLASPQVLNAIERTSDELVACIKRRGTITLCGNGGSACDAMHFCEELVARFHKDRPGVRARHLMDQSTLTCWANDYNFDSVFARQVETLCEPADLLIGFSTSGNSKNVLLAVEAAKKLGVKTIALTGKDGGKIKSLADLSIVIPSENTAHIQEAHITLVHAWCEVIDGLY